MDIDQRIVVHNFVAGGTSTLYVYDPSTNAARARLASCACWKRRAALMSRPFFSVPSGMRALAFTSVSPRSALATAYLWLWRTWRGARS